MRAVSVADFGTKPTVVRVRVRVRVQVQVRVQLRVQERGKRMTYQEAAKLSCELTWTDLGLIFSCNARLCLVAAGGWPAYKSKALRSTALSISDGMFTRDGGRSMQ